jgi:peptidoglycan/LPS O-acetylase OafA/YrhL
MDKEEGEIAILEFYRNRFLRIWPVLAAAVITNIIGIAIFDGKNMWQIFSGIFFINNFVDTNNVQIYWSIAIEF